MENCILVCSCLFFSFSRSKYLLPRTSPLNNGGSVLTTIAARRYSSSALVFLCRHRHIHNPLTVTAPTWHQLIWTQNTRYRGIYRPYTSAAVREPILQSSQSSITFNGQYSLDARGHDPALPFHKNETNAAYVKQSLFPLAFPDYFHSSSIRLYFQGVVRRPASKCILWFMWTTAPED
jgi:hypothetical protein